MLLFGSPNGWQPPARPWAVAVLCALLALACPRTPQTCQDPTGQGMCFCPMGASCHHDCGEATGHCTLGCAQSNPSCSVACADDCTSLCSGAGRCQSACGKRCNVSCEYVKETCTATVGDEARVNCTGAASCNIQCQGRCQVECPQGHCRLICAPGRESGCEMSCGDSAAPAALCSDGSRVCGRSC